MCVCHIVGAGECRQLELKAESGDLIIAADGGYKHLENAKIKPHIVIGDFDSLCDIPPCDEVIKLNPVKDVTDMYAAVEVGIDRGFNRFYLYGAMGGRVDHSLANIQLIASLAQKNIKAFIFDGEKVITALYNETIEFDSSNSGYVSVFAHSDECRGVTLKGLKYPLENAVLKNTFSLGVSNEFLSTESEITVKKGTAIIIYKNKQKKGN